MVIDKAKEKIEESKYFLKKMIEIESSCDSSGGAKDREKEFSHILSAFLNSCYSVGEILKQEAKYFDLHRNLRLKRRDIYKNGEEGGWRTIAVHYEPVNLNSRTIVTRREVRHPVWCKVPSDAWWFRQPEDVDQALQSIQ